MYDTLTPAGNNETISLLANSVRNFSIISTATSRNKSGKCGNLDMKEITEQAEN